eukprot:COSAG06_NODE_66981_length_253_cov_0.655844_1_plen_77_part_01
MAQGSRHQLCHQLRFLAQNLVSAQKQHVAVLQVGGIMWSTQEKIENCALICSSALPEYEAGTHEARLVFTFYRHLNL